jgi:hypothetical protein
MLIEFTRKAQADGQQYKKGDVADIISRIAEKMVARGYAKLHVPSEAVAEADDGPADC